MIFSFFQESFAGISSDWLYLSLLEQATVLSFDEQSILVVGLHKLSYGCHSGKLIDSFSIEIFDLFGSFPQLDVKNSFKSYLSVGQICMFFNHWKSRRSFRFTCFLSGYPALFVVLFHLPFIITVILNHKYPKSISVSHLHLDQVLRFWKWSF